MNTRIPDVAKEFTRSMGVDIQQQVYSALDTMIYRVTQSKLPTNLCRINMHPGIWWMIKTSFQHDFRSDNHKFFIDQVPSIVKLSTIQFIKNLMNLQTRLETESP
jgi:hypothetical protein